MIVAFVLVVTAVAAVFSVACFIRAATMHVPPPDRKPPKKLRRL
jgi:hypothetical protein